MNRAVARATPFTGTLLLGHLHWDHTQGLPFSQALDADDSPTSRCSCRAQEGDGPVEVLLAGRCRRPTSRSCRPQLRGALDVLVARGRPPLDRRLRRARPRHPPQGRPHVRLPGHVDGPAGRWPTCPTTGRSSLGPGPDGLGEYHAAALALCRRASTCSSTTRSTPPPSSRPGRTSATPPIEYAVELARPVRVDGAAVPPRPVPHRRRPGRARRRARRPGRRRGDGPRLLARSR